MTDQTSDNKLEEKAVQDFELSQDIVKAVEFFTQHEPKKVKDFELKITQYLAELERLDLRDTQIRSSSVSKNLIGKILYFIFGFPIFIFGFVTCLIPFKLSGFISDKIIIREDFVGAIKIAVGLLVFTFLFAIESTLIGMYTDTLWGILFFIALYPAGAFTLAYITNYYKFRGSIKYLNLFMRKSDVVANMKVMRKELINELEARKEEFIISQEEIIN